MYTRQSSSQDTVIYGGNVEAELIIHCFLSVADVIQYMTYSIQSLERSLWKSQLGFFWIHQEIARICLTR